MDFLYSGVAEVTVQTHFTYRVIKFKLVQFNKKCLELDET